MLISLVIAASLFVEPLATTSPAASESTVPKIEFEKFTLDNGMKVILAPDRRLPLVAINTWFYVGAKDEPPGRSGFAHLFEHLMFMGTERVPVGQFDRIMEAVGGTNNASTDFDRTNYFSSGPANILPTLLWLDADRLEDLGRAMTQDKLEAQRAIVRNERRQSIENVPYGKSELRITEMMYPIGHPYHFEVIGSHEELEAATLEDVKEFFANFYVPNNASLVVCGDFDPAIVKPLIESQFGTLSRGATVPRRDLSVPDLVREERFTMLDLVDAPMVRFAWHTPVAYSREDAELILLARVLADDQSGRLHDRLVIKEGLASEVSVRQQGLMARSMFRVDVRALPGADLDRIEAIVHEELGKVAREGVPDAELARARARQELDILAPFDQLLRKADKLNEYEFYFGRPDGFEADIARFAAVQGDAIASLATRTFGAPGRAVVRVLPQEPERARNPRDERPADFAPTSFTPPAPTLTRLDNGVTIESYSIDGVPRVELEIAFSPERVRATNGRIDPLGFEGTTRLLADLLREGAGDLDGPALAAAFSALGAEFDPRATREKLALRLAVPEANFDAALALLSKVVLEPRLALPDFERVKAIVLEELKQRNASPRAVSEQVADRWLFGESHPLGTLEDGTLDSVGGIGHGQVVALHRELVAANHARVFVAGKLDARRLDATARACAGWNSSKLVSDAAKPHAAVLRADTTMPRVLLVDRPGAVQTAIQFAWNGPSHSDSNRVAAEMLAIVMGGSFTSRLNQNLREEKGYTYGARCSLESDRGHGKLTAFAAVRADVTGASLKEFLAEFARMRGGDLTTEEAKRAKSLFRVNHVERFEGLRSRVATLAELARLGLGVDSVTKDLAASDALSQSALAKLANSVFDYTDGVLVLVGDSKTILPQLEGLGLPMPLRVTPEGAPIAP